MSTTSWKSWYLPRLIQDSTYLFKAQLWKFIHSQAYVGWIKMKTYSPTSFPSPQENIFLTVTENKFIVWNYHFSGPASIYLFEFSNINSRIKCEICLKLTTEVPHVVLVSLLLTLNIFYFKDTMKAYFSYWHSLF